MANFRCTNCYTEESADDREVDFQSGGYTCTLCKHDGLNSTAAVKRKGANKREAFATFTRLFEILEKGTLE